VTRSAATTADAELLIQAQRYLTQRANGQPPRHDLEAAWLLFFDFYSHKIRKYAFKCGVAEEDIADCTQEVWTELLVRLPAFQLDASRGKFDSWLFHIVRGKTVDLHRCHKHRLLQANSCTLQTVIDHHPNHAQVLEEEEMFTLAWDQLRKALSECNFQLLQMRLLEQRPVAEVAEELGISHEQVWYRYHRARREAEKIGADWGLRQCAARLHDERSHEKTE